MEGHRFNFIVVIGFAVIGIILLALGIIFLALGLGIDTYLYPILFGLGLIVAALALATEFGFIEGKGTLGPIYSGP